jgi:hypothetical protein
LQQKHLESGLKLAKSGQNTLTAATFAGIGAAKNNQLWLYSGRTVISKAAQPRFMAKSMECHESAIAS